jgi:hypothetical protein
MTIGSRADKAKEEVKQAVRKAAPWAKGAARIGLAARGTVYLLVGLMAALTAAGVDQPTPGPKGALRTLGDQPLGPVLLLAVAIGLAAYSLWCLLQGLLDPEREAEGSTAWLQRAGKLGKALGYALLAVGAVRLALGEGAGSEETAAKGWTAELMAFPFGRWLVGSVGLGIIAFGLFQVYRGSVAKLDKQLRLGDMPPLLRKSAVPISRFGIAARGVVFGVVGTFLVIAAVRANPGAARGVGGALAALRQQSYGPALLAAAALGLIAFGLYGLLLAWYRHVRVA